MRWEWLPEYLPFLVHGLWITLSILVLSLIFGIVLAIPIGLVQVTGPWPLAKLAKAYCTFMRGTPLLVQLWLLYYGLGSFFPSMPWLRGSFLWPVLREGFFYAVLTFSLNFAGYEGEIMRGAFLGVPKGELEAARAFGMGPWKLLSRVWFPRAVRLVLPTLAGETVLQLKATPLAFTVTVMDLMGATSMVRQKTYLTYEPLLFLSAVYLVLTFAIVKAFGYVEAMVPQRR
jgi:polar amino acid transport system permease protein